ncbi:hypothetical protein CLF_103163 [Clonorchis sinensis]|uniref:Uncharacterized protein n=1 Tax=Clonorchis sinensis TaxID=79923 RepID=G7Y970_CLOSI|nr:hypothetical protein CLF_103163 [Clonorchis sinensis]
MSQSLGEPKWPEWNIYFSLGSVREIQRKVSFFQRDSFGGARTPVLFKEGDGILVNSLKALLRKSWHENRAPVEQNASTLTSIPKKEKRILCKNIMASSL